MSLGAQVPTTPRPAGRIPNRHVVDQAEVASRDGRCPGVRAGHLEALTEAGKGITIDPGTEFLGGEARLAADLRHRVEHCVRIRLVFFGVP